MLSNRPALSQPAAPGTPVDPELPHAWQALFLFLGFAAVLYLVMGLVAPHLPAGGHPVAPRFTGPSWLRGWAQWDSGWYRSIVTNGYSYVRGRQSSIAFFPAYPLLVRPVAALLPGDPYVAGILVTFVFGAGVTVLLFGWLRRRLSPPAAWTALAAFLLYPYTFYLYGVVYDVAVCIAAELAALLLLDARPPVPS